MAGLLPGPRRTVRQRLLLVLALFALLASAAFSIWPVRAEVLGVRVDCGASVVAGGHGGEGFLGVERRLACHDAAAPWRTAALASALVSLGASVAATVALRRRVPLALAVPPPA